MLAKKLADYVLEKETMIKVDTPLSVYASTFIVYGEELNIDGADAFIQYALDTNYFKDAENSGDEFPDIPAQVTRILKSVKITDEAKEIVKKVVAL